MTRPKASRYPVSSFGPELMSVLVKGSKEKVEINFPDFRSMCAFQQRIHMLRGAMSREQHPQYAIVTRAKTSRYWEGPSKGGRTATNCKLTISPRDSEFADILKRSGHVVEQEVMHDLLEDMAPPTTAPADQTIIASSSDDDTYGDYK